VRYCILGNCKRSLLSSCSRYLCHIVLQLVLCALLIKWWRWWRWWWRCKTTFRDAQHWPQYTVALLVVRPTMLQNADSISSLSSFHFI